MPKRFPFNVNGNFFRANRGKAAPKIEKEA
jgi:hypothetical protein